MGFFSDLFNPAKQVRNAVRSITRPSLRPPGIPGRFDPIGRVVDGVIDRAVDRYDPITGGVRRVVEGAIDDGVRRDPLYRRFGRELFEDRMAERERQAQGPDMTIQPVPTPGGPTVGAQPVPAPGPNMGIQPVAPAPQRPDMSIQPVPAPGGPTMGIQPVGPAVPAKPDASIMPVPNPVKPGGPNMGTMPVPAPVKPGGPTMGVQPVSPAVPGPKTDVGIQPVTPPVVAKPPATNVGIQPVPAPGKAPIKTPGPTMGVPGGYKGPAVLSSTDGTATKDSLASAANEYRSAWDGDPNQMKGVG